jgi:subtilase family serine protease
LRRTISLTAVACLATAALALAAPAGQAAPPASPSSNGVTVAHSCATPTQQNVMACKALHVTAGTPKSAHAESDLTAAAAPSGYGPASLQAAYNLPSSSGGSGQTVAIVDAYDDPNAEADLAVYRSQYGLSACTTANGCFKKVNQTGGTSYPRGDSGWAEEISLDLDMVSAACPNCKILLVEASSATMTNLGTAVNTAVRLGAKYVSNSYGGSESSSDSTYDSSYFNHPGVAITVSSGDNGYGPEYPAASKYVTAVGGTSLKTSSTARGWTDTVWSGAGSGCSSYDAKPTWQTDSGCAKRTVADVSAVADPNTGVAVYDSYRQATGWMVFGGTSASAPLIAATYALAGAPSSGSYPASFPYAHTSALYDVTSGSNGTCSGSYLCTGTTGYDGPTGLGVPNGTAAFTG